MRLIAIEDISTGHNRPLFALVNELSKLQQTEVIKLKLNDDLSSFARTITPSNFSKTLIIGAGHQSHKKIKSLKKFFLKHKNVFSVALMKPTFGIKQYDLVITPKHDFGKSKLPSNVITHEGSLAEVSFVETLKDTLLIAIGGPTAKMQFQDKLLLSNISHILNVHPHHKVFLCNSRRTPQDLWNKVTKMDHALLNIFDVENTSTEKFQHLIATSSKKFVTPDSINLVSECLSSMGATYVIQANDVITKQSTFSFRRNKFNDYYESIKSKGLIGYVGVVGIGQASITQIHKPQIKNSPMCEVEKVAYEIKKRLEK